MVTIKLRRGTAAQWVAVNPVLADGEVGIESAAGATPDRAKIGDGVTTWNALPYTIVSGVGTYVEGTVQLTVGAVAPSSPEVFDLWVDST